MFSSSRAVLRFMARVAVFLVVLAGVSEVWLRTITPAAAQPLPFQDAVSTLRRNDPNGPRQGLYTVGRLAERGGVWRVNNDGWISAVDYLPSAERSHPLIAILGDSYIEAFHTDVGQHLDAYLAEALPDVDVYAFGRAGWYLEQYVACARYVRETYDPDLLVVFIDNNDVKDSVREKRVLSTALWQISHEGGSFSEVGPAAQPPTASRKVRLAQQSAIIRYLVYNAKVRLPGMANAGVPQPAQSAQDPANVGAADAWRTLLPAARFMVSSLCEQNPGTPLLFVVHDVNRYLALDEVKAGQLFNDGRAIQEACLGNDQCTFLDLRFVFAGDWALHQVQFEAADGGHWNAYANELIANALVDLIRERDLLARDSQ